MEIFYWQNIIRIYFREIIRENQSTIEASHDKNQRMEFVKLIKILHDTKVV